MFELKESQFVKHEKVIRVGKFNSQTHQETYFAKIKFGKYKSDKLNSGTYKLEDRFVKYK